MSISFVHLNVHTEYSLVDGILRVEEMCAETADRDMPAIAVTEQSNLFSVIKHYRTAQQYGIKPVIGVQIRLLDDHDTESISRLTLLCKDLNGYHNLGRIVTRSYTEGQIHGLPCVRREWLYANHEGLIALSGGREGDIGQAILNGKEERAAACAHEWQSLFGDRFYIELQRAGRPGDEECIPAGLHIAEKAGIPVVATNDVRFLAEEDYEAHETRVCIQHGHTLNDPRRPRDYTPLQYLKNPAEMQELFHDIPEALENTLAIARRCNLELTLGRNYLPDFHVPENFDQDGWLQHESRAGLECYLAGRDNNDFDQQTYEERLESELEVIIKMGFAGYFLIVADFIQWAKKQGIPVGPGRGSGAGSLVAYALGITELDPLKYDLLFERFLNPERVSLPDFDIDFCMDRRDEVIDYVAEKYGRERVSQIITYGTMAAKAVVRDVGRVLGHPYGFVDQIAKLIPFELNITLERALEEEEDLARRYREEDEVNTLIDLAQKLEGLVRNAGRHAGGIVIAPRPLTEYMPLYCEQGTSATVTQLDMGDVEAVGLVKFDFLGLRTLTIIDHAVKDVNRMHTDEQNAPLDILDIPLDDERTYNLIRKTDTTAVFQLESDGMKKLIKRLQPDNFNDLIALVALFRPGPLQSGMVDDYVDRKHGQARIHYLHPMLEEVLKPTYGVILYQEQVMEIARILASYTLGAADLLRRAMGKKKPGEMALQRETFIQGAIANKVDANSASMIFDLMEKFAGYGFNKSHSAAYALIAYQTAWLKAHHPAAFMAAVLSSDMDNTDKVVMLLDELERMGIKLEPPHVNTCQYEFTVASDNSIYYGLGAIKGAGRSAIENIIEERDCKGEFPDLFDFCKRLDPRKVNRRVLEALVKAGALDGLGPGRSSIFSSLQSAIQFAEQTNRNSLSGQDDLFGLDAGGGVTGTDDASRFTQVPDWSDEERLTGEKETLGFYLKGHPIIRYEAELANVISARLKDIRPGNVTVAGYIHRMRTRSGRQGRMAEIVLDDRTARANLTVYSDCFQQHRNKLIKDQLIVVKGDVVEDDYFQSGHAIIAREIFTLDEIRTRFGRLKLRLTRNCSEKETIQLLNKTLSPYRNGKCLVAIEYRNGEASCNLSLGEQWRVMINDRLIDILKDRFGNESVSVEYGL
ncbi:MAG TPA: DNA polymerase III subunit alpha [Gammaproteobacteria bacterium]|nr:DNA polymerase III subunit alpha [Gammaproteobacteria bacterium]